MDNSRTLDLWATDASEDESALVRAAAREPTAFATLHGRYEPRVYQYLRSRTESPEDADDLTQQVFLQALAALPRYEHRDTPFAAWLFRIARNVATDHHRRRRETVAWDLLPEALHPTADHADPEAVAMRREGSIRLREAMAGLSPDERELLALRFAAGLTLREIGAVIGRSESRAQRRLAAVLQTLKEALHAR